MVSIMSA